MFVQVSATPEMIVFGGDLACIYAGNDSITAFVWFHEGLMHCSMAQWRASNNIKVDGYYTLKRAGNSLTFTTYRKCKMYKEGSSEYTEYEPGTLINVTSNHPRYLHRTYVFD